MRRRPRGRRQQRGPGCQLPPAGGWPQRAASIRALKYIGRHLEQQFNALGVLTLQNLVDLVDGKSRAQNTRDFLQVFANPRNAQCVRHTPNRDTEHWANPWANETIRPRRRRGEVIAGNYWYCVREYNKCGWQAVVSYLQAQPNADVRDNRIPHIRDRRMFCHQADPAWCLEQRRRGRNNRSEDPENEDEDEDPGNDDEDEVPAQFSPGQLRTMREQRERAENIWEDMDQEMDFQDDREEESDVREEESDDDILRQAFSNPPQFFNPHQIRSWYKGRVRDAIRSQDLSPLQSIAFVLRLMSSADDLAVLSVRDIAFFTGLSRERASKLMNAHKGGKGQSLFNSPRRGFFSLAAFDEDTRRFLSSIE